jgi:hypothetical protein
MIKVGRKRRFWSWLYTWGMPLAVYTSLLLFALTSGWWQAAILGGYFIFSFILFVSGRTGTIGVIFITMLPVIQNKIDLLQKWQDKAHEKTLDEVREIEPDVVELNYEQQLFDRGVDANDKRITPGYTPFTVRLKGYRGQPTDRVTLRDEGDFHASFALEFERDEFTVVSGDWKEAKLKEKYGEAILGLTDPNIQKVIDWIRNPLSQAFKKMVL